MTLEQLKSEVRRAGWTPSAGSLETDRSIIAFSAETHGPESYNSSRYLMIWDKDRHSLQVTGSPRKHERPQ